MSLICTTCNLNVENCKCEKKKACPVECGVIKQLFQIEIDALEEEIKMWVSRDNWRAATERKDKLRGIEHMLIKLQYNGIAL